MSPAQQIRLEALTLANRSGVRPGDVLLAASSYEKYIYDGELTDDHSRRIENRLVERLRYTGLDEDTISKVLISIRDENLQFYTRKG